MYIVHFLEFYKSFGKKDTDKYFYLERVGEVVRILRVEITHLSPSCIFFLLYHRMEGVIGLFITLVSKVL